MNILVTSAKDATNLSLENIIRVLLQRGHTLEVFAQHMDSATNRMFTQFDLPIHPVRELTPAVVSKFDVALTGTDAMGCLRLADIYTFAYNFMPTQVGVTEGADFMFTRIANRHCPYLEDCASMPVGDTKNDALPVEREHKQQFLYIDAGHYPWGERGKHQVAEMLLSICRKFPDYRLVVKPRWLLDQDAVQTHKSTLHIYKVLQEVSGGVLPDNFVLLQEHKNLQSLIDDCDCVITTSISCYLDAALRGKPCMVVDGLDSEEQFETRNAFADAFAQARASGCCVPFWELPDRLPKGVLCDSAHLCERIPYLQGASQRVAEVMEYVYCCFLQNGQYPKIQEYCYETYRQKMEADPSLNLTELKYRRVENAMIYRMRGLEGYKAPVDLSGYYTFMQQIYRSYPLTNEGFRNLETVMLAKRRSIVLEHQELLMNDPIDQALLFQIMYDTGHYDALVALPEDQILCPEAYYYCMGMIHLNWHNNAESLPHLCRFLQGANQRSFEKYPMESAWGIRTAYSCIIKLYNGSNIPPQTMGNLYVQLCEKGNDRLLILSDRMCWHNVVPRLCQVLEECGERQLASQCALLYVRNMGQFGRDTGRDNEIQRLNKEIEKIHKSLSYRLGRALTWPVRVTRGGIRCCKEHGIRYTFTLALGRLKSRLIPAFIKKDSHFLRIRKIFREQVLAGFQVYSQLCETYGDQAQILLSAHATGDAYIFGQYVWPFIKKRYSGKTPVFCVSGKGSVDVGKLFGLPFVHPFSKTEFHNMYNLLMFVDQEQLHAVNMHYHLIYQHICILAHLDGLHGFTIGSLPQAFLGMEDGDKIPPAFCSDVSYLDRLGAEMKLKKGKTIVLAPYAKSCRPLPPNIWRQLATILRLRGYTVCTNSAGGGEPAIAETVPFCVPYRYAVPFLEWAGACISLRSGFCDVISTAQCLKIALYPKENWKHGEFADCNQVYDMRKIYGQADQYDLIYDKEDSAMFVGKIIDLVVSYLEKQSVPEEGVFDEDRIRDSYQIEQ